MKNLFCLATAAIIAPAAFCQKTQPISPNTPDVKVPPLIAIKSPEDIVKELESPVDAQEAALIAIRYQQSLAVVKAQIKQARGGKVSAQAAMNPTLALSSTYTDLDYIEKSSSASSGSSQGYSSSLALKQLLFDFNHSPDLLRQAEYVELAARLGFRASLSNLISDVKKAYYAVQGNEGLVRAAEANVEARQNQLKMAQAKLLSGMGAPADVISAKTNLSDAVLSLTQSRQTLSLSKMALAQAIGVDPRTEVKQKASAEFAVEANNLDDLVKQGLANRPEQAQSSANIKAAEAGLAAAKTGNAPSLVFSAGLGGRGEKDPAATSYGTFGLTLSWSFSDGGSTKGKLEQAKASLDAAKASAAVVEQTLVSDVSQAYLALKTAEQRVEVTSAALANAREAVRLTEGRYREGFATFVEITSAQASAFSAENADIAAKVALEQARVALNRAVGATAKDLK